jgi:hypothetical protein
MDDDQELSFNTVIPISLKPLNPKQRSGERKKKNLPQRVEGTREGKEVGSNPAHSGPQHSDGHVHPRTQVEMGSPDARAAVTSCPPVIILHFIHTHKEV